MRLTSTWCWVENEEVVVHLFVNLHDACFITTTVAVVWRGEDSYDLLLVRPIVALNIQKRQKIVKMCNADEVMITYRHDQLVSPCHCFKTILLDELIGDVLPECVARTARRNTPACAIIWVRPEQVAHGPLMRYFHDAVNLPNHVQCVETW